MKNKKRVFKYFTIMEYEQEQEYLRKQHRAGWRFDRVAFPGIYSFVKCEPEDVVYQLDYNKEGTAAKAEYVQMFEDCGWEYITDMAGYSYFRKAVSLMKAEEEEIFCDDASKLEMIERVFKGRMIPLLVIFFLIIIPQLLIQSRIGHAASWALFWLYVGLFVLYLVIFVKFWKHYRHLKDGTH